MPAFTFTADAATDQLTIAGHGLLTGDGPVAVRNLGGALPGALTPVTEYWAIRVDANHIKLATSNPAALAGTAINLTSDGTGTQLLEVGIPYRIATTYVPGSPIKSADLTAMQAALQAIHGLFTGQAQSVWSSFTPIVESTLAGGLAGPLKLKMTSVVSPAGSTNDWAPTGVESAIVVQIATTAASVITGLSGGSAGRLLHLINFGGHSVTLNHEDAASSAVNRFQLPGGASLVMAGSSGQSASLLHEGSRWRLLSKNF